MLLKIQKQKEMKIYLVIIIFNFISKIEILREKILKHEYLKVLENN